MKICRYKYNAEIYFGAIENDSIFPIENAELIEEITDSNDTGEPVRLTEVELLFPFEPSKIVCVGRNYSAHAKELGNEVPAEPLLFLKAPSSLILANHAITIPRQSKQVEHEGELGAVIGRKCKNLTDDDNPFEYIFGYICLNDVTARDLQRKDVQFTRAKSFDTFCPISSYVETNLDVSDIRVATKVNGIVKQEGRTSEMVFSVPFLIRYISNQMTLNAGDIIATGTPSGVSVLKDGDVCEVEIEGIGVLRNPVKNMEKI
ncbi:MAG TPA: fumarylacetoacetate hydrolase family protein [Pyrinomonadaceae bacterium]|jgi:2-keto-4-pentenoate hydratase/2-oxohepta-3-ene-1,7-dioic acid hydratase in catechol pathway